MAATEATTRYGAMKRSIRAYSDYLRGESEEQDEHAETAAADGACERQSSTRSGSGSGSQCAVGREGEASEPGDGKDYRDVDHVWKHAHSSRDRCDNRGDESGEEPERPDEEVVVHRRSCLRRETREADTSPPSYRRVGGDDALFAPRDASHGLPRMA